MAMTTVKADNIIPIQQTKSALKILRSADCYQQKFLKFPYVAIAHSLAELQKMALLEADKKVTNFVPQPFMLRVGKRRYVPDCFYERKGKKYVIELKPAGTDFAHIADPVKHFLKRKNITYSVVSNESVYEQSILAENWLYIIRTLNTSKTIDTDLAENELRDELYDGPLSIEQILSLGDRLDSSTREVAMYKMAWRGQIEIDLDEAPMSADTEVKLC
jgi:hypothetical protein